MAKAPRSTTRCIRGIGSSRVETSEARKRSREGLCTRFRRWWQVLRLLHPNCFNGSITRRPLERDYLDNKLAYYAHIPSTYVHADARHHVGGFSQMKRLQGRRSDVAI